MAFLFGLILLLAVVIAGLVWFTANTARRVEAVLPPRGQFMEIDGQRIHYVDSGGNKPAVVMIHGLGGNLLHFGYAMADKLSNDFRVILVDRPGSGYSTPARRCAGHADRAGQNHRHADPQARARQPLVVGHSLGGAMSLALALDHPDCVGGLTLLAPFTHAQEDVPDVFKGIVIPSPLVRKVIAWTVATPLGVLFGHKIVAAVFAPEPVPADFPIRGGGLARFAAARLLHHLYRSHGHQRRVAGYVARYKSLSIPMAMLYGKGDRLLDYRRHGDTMKATCPRSISK